MADVGTIEPEPLYPPCRATSMKPVAGDRCEGCGASLPVMVLVVRSVTSFDVTAWCAPCRDEIVTALLNMSSS